MARSNKRARNLQRLAHLAGSAVLGLYFYSPLGDEAAFTTAIQWGVLPGLTVSGLLLWQWTRLWQAMAGGRRVAAPDGG